MVVPKIPIFVHNLHFKIKIGSEYYNELDLPRHDKNSGKRHSENIGRRIADYVLYPNGTLDIHVACSNNPFRLEMEQDRSRVIAFFGQIRDRLIILLRDEHERIIPDIMDWQITECDINKDIKISHLLHFSAMKIQVKHLDHLFRIYVKGIGQNTVCRIEESMHSDKPALQVITDIFNPVEKIERQIAEFRNEVNTKLSEFYDIVSQLLKNKN